MRVVRVESDKIVFINDSGRLSEASVKDIFDNLIYMLSLGIDRKPNGEYAIPVHKDGGVKIVLVKLYQLVRLDRSGCFPMYVGSADGRELVTEKVKAYLFDDSLPTFKGCSWLKTFAPTIEYLALKIKQKRG